MVQVVYAWVIFENSGHFPHLEETERYLQVLDRFLKRVEAGWFLGKTGKFLPTAG